MKLKAQYEVGHLTAPLNKRINNADAVKKYTNYARKEGFEILPPDINKSFSRFTVENGNIRFGLGALKNVGTGLMDIIVEERNRGGDFKSFEDFLRRVNNNALNKKSVESMILSGVFASFGAYRSQLIEIFPPLMEMINSDRKSQASGQFSMFDTFEEASQSVNKVELPNIKEFNKDTLLKYEKNYVGIYLSGHPLDSYLAKYDTFNFTSDMIADMNVDFDEQQSEDEGGEYYQAEQTGEEEEAESQSQVKDGQAVMGGGIITAVKKIATKTGNMAFLTIEDIYGTFDVMLFSKMYSKYKDIAVEDNLITVKGKLSIRDGKSPVVLAESIIPWEMKDEQPKDTRKMYLRFNTQDIDVYNNVKKIASTYTGDVPVVIKCSQTGKAFSFNTKVDINNYILNELTGLLGEGNVIVK